jgi:uncharacterized protein
MTMRTLLLIFALWLVPAQLPALEAPPLTGRVNDLAHLLSPESSQQLEQKLDGFERETSNQVVVLTIPSLQGDEIDPFSIRVADAWKIGQKGRDNGVLLIIAQAERKVRIEVGMGLQGALPDITTGRIIREVMRPYLKSGNFDQGVTAGVDSIIAATKGEFKGTGQPTGNRVAKKSSPSFLLMLLGAVVAVAVTGLFSRYLGAFIGAFGLPLATYLAFPGLELVTLLILVAGGLVFGFLLSLVVATLFGGDGGGSGGIGGSDSGGSLSGGSDSSGSDDSFSGDGGGFDGGGSSDDY